MFSPINSYKLGDSSWEEERMGGGWVKRRQEVKDEKGVMLINVMLVSQSVSEWGWLIEKLHKSRLIINGVSFIYSPESFSIYQENLSHIIWYNLPFFIVKFLPQWMSNIWLMLKYGYQANWTWNNLLKRKRECFEEGANCFKGGEGLKWRTERQTNGRTGVRTDRQEPMV